MAPYTACEKCHEIYDTSLPKECRCKLKVWGVNKILKTIAIKAVQVVFILAMLFVFFGCQVHVDRWAV
jgi:hypothetical protein